MWCSSSSTGLLSDLKREFVCQLGQLGMQLDQLGWNFAFGLRREVGAVDKLGPRQQLSELLVADALVDLFNEAQIFIQETHEAGEVGAFDACWRSRRGARSCPRRRA